MLYDFQVLYGSRQGWNLLNTPHRCCSGLTASQHRLSNLLNSLVGVSCKTATLISIAGVQAETAPNLCWLPARVAADCHLSKRLITLLDREKAITPSFFSAETTVEANTAKVEDGAEQAEGEGPEKEAVDGDAVKAEEGAEKSEPMKEEEKAGNGKEEGGGDAEKSNGDAMETDEPAQDDKPAGKHTLTSLSFLQACKGPKLGNLGVAICQIFVVSPLDVQCYRSFRVV